MGNGLEGPPVRQCLCLSGIVFSSACNPRAQEGEGDGEKACIFRGGGWGLYRQKGNGPTVQSEGQTHDNYIPVYMYTVYKSTVA